MWLQGLKRRETRRRLELVGLVAGLCLLFALAIAFVLFIIQLQGAGTAYSAGQSRWSRAQLSTVFALYRYAEHGDPVDLASARTQLDVPIGDMEARRAMSQDPVDRQAAVAGLLQGRNHPEDIPAMIWLYRHFSDWPHLRDAVAVWEASDTDLEALSQIADDLEQAHVQPGPLPEARRAALMDRLERVNARAYERTEAFIGALTDATRWLRQTLMITGVVVMGVVGLLATLLGWRLVRVVSASRRRFKAIFEQAAVGMAELTANRQFISVNAALCDILGYSEKELLTRRLDDLLHSEERETESGGIHDMGPRGNGPVTLEQRFVRCDGGIVWGKLTMSVIGSRSGASATRIAVIEDVSESRRLSFELAHQADHDSLTGLLNRRALERELARALRMVREQQTPHALCYIDLDEFKVVNDTCGHAAGDQMLRQITELLREQLREGDILARLGGDEFGMLLRGCDLTAGSRVAEKLCRVIEEFRFDWDGRRFNVSCSMGVVPVTGDLPDIDAALRAADIACYLAKEQGRNRVHATEPDDSLVSRRRGEMEWLSRIRTALDEDRFYLDAQRIVPLDGEVSPRYEVLVRLLDEDGQIVAPGAFLPPAERFGAVQEIDRWVITRVCRMLADNPDHLKDLEACHINISGRSFDRPEFLEFVIKTLRYHGVSADRLCLEITETAAIRNLGDATEFMTALRQRGCRFALDDFGAGLSSFGYLRRLPVDYLKIDGVFVRDIVSDTADHAMVRAINEVGQSLGKQIIAEFVETEEAMGLLREMGVHYGQGFGIHRPERFEVLIEAYRRGTFKQ